MVSSPQADVPQPAQAEEIFVPVERPVAAAEPEQTFVLLEPAVAAASEPQEEEPYVSILLEPIRQPEPEPEPVMVYTAEPPFQVQPQTQVSTVIPFSTPAMESAQSASSSPLPALELPAGFHDRSVLNSFLQSSDVLTGVVVAIGINDYPHHTEKLGHAPMQDLMRNVEQMIGGMLRPNLDFGCRSTDDEFILVFVNEVGSDAQRRLSTISERLWNFQLRSLSNFSVLFSWGAVEVQNETLADAAASASERMYQTKRNRKTVSLDGQRRKLAVNL
jgi:GGDEF domain-containing protein